MKMFLLVMENGEKQRPYITPALSVKEMGISAVYIWKKAVLGRRFE